MRRPFVRRRVAHDVLRVRQPVRELCLELSGRRELRVMVELDVRHHRDLGGQREHRAVRLVALDDEVPAAEAGVRAELRHRRADQPRRVVPGLAQGERDHRGRRALPMCAADDDRRPRADELAQELRAAHPRDGWIRRRDDRLPPVRHDRFRRDLDRHVGERVEVRRAHAVPPADLGA